jgi:predicted RNA polymerase sigma factor
MLKAEHVPMEVKRAMRAAWARRNNSDAPEKTMADLLIAAINAWPGMDYQPGAMVTKTWRDPGKIILPLPKENTND